MLKIEDSQMSYCYVVTSWTGYEKSQKEGKDCLGNKINLVIKKSSNIEKIVYYYIINQY